MNDEELVPQSGTPAVARADADKQKVLLAVEAIVRVGLVGDWNEDAAKDLASVVNDRSDLDYEDVQKLASEVVETEQPTKQRVKALLGQIATSGVGGALGTGIHRRSG
jgi:hydrogenase maturation factor HypE